MSLAVYCASKMKHLYLICQNYLTHFALIVEQYRTSSFKFYPPSAMSKKKRLIIFSILIGTEMIFLYKINYDLKRLCPGENAPIDFDHFNNTIGTPNGCYIVPNIIHFLRFTGEPVIYLHMICYLAAFKHHKPDKIYFHYDNFTTFSGRYWEILKNTEGFMDIVEFHFMEMPTEIFGQQLSDGWLVYHSSDITRIRILMKYGGIFLDNDLYVIKSLNDFRRYEMTIGWDHQRDVLGTQCLLAHKDARFLNLWLETYRGAYDKTLWYYNAGERPVHEVLNKRRELVHRVYHLFGVETRVTKIYASYWKVWKRYLHALHLLYRHLYILGDKQKLYPKVFNETNVLEYSNTLREMVLKVYNPTNVTFEVDP